MPAEDVAYLFPLALIFGLFAFKFLSSRVALSRARIAAEKSIRGYRGESASDPLFVDGSSAKVSLGSEEVIYGFFALDYYSRRFLIEYEGKHFLAIVTSGQEKPFMKLLDPARAELVSRHKEWTQSVA
jgi:hypothetical protein